MIQSCIGGIILWHSLTYQREFLDMKMQKQCHGTSVNEGLLESRMNDLYFVSSLTYVDAGDELTLLKLFVLVVGVIPRLITLVFSLMLLLSDRGRLDLFSHSSVWIFSCFSIGFIVFNDDVIKTCHEEDIH